MESLIKDPISIPNLCEWCGGAGTSRCGRCHIAYYCSRDHQMQHWSIHKKVCKKSLPPLVPLYPSAPGLTFPSSGNWGQSNTPFNLNEEINRLSVCSNIYESNSGSSSNEEINPLAVCSNMYSSNSGSSSSDKPIDFNIPITDDILSSFTNDFLSSDNNFWNLIDTGNIQNVSELDVYLGKDVVNQISGFQDQFSSSVIQSIDPNSPADDDVNLMECASLNDICKNVVHDLNTYGICVLDKFIGFKCGNLILEEVKNLYEAGIFRKGQLVNPTPYSSTESVRSDVTTWVDGTEPYCKNIGNLIQKLDLVLATCNKMQNNGLLSKYKLHRRTKAMVACYPGNGTHYKKHVDNPHKDGRCITCIYYLNKNWDVQKHGGILRMFPSIRDSDVAQIDPIFDRMIFFWSDKRNPHEVLPALATRFAITVWYFDADERDAALKAIRQKNLLSQMQSSS